MSTATAPDPYFKGITYNPSFFSSSSTSLTQAQANSLYLRKTTADTATALETFSGGLSSTSIDSTSATTDMTIGSNLTNGDLNICGSQTGGDINIGVNATRNSFGYIRIGTTDTVSANVPIIIGNVNSTTAMKGTCSFSNEISATGISSTANIEVKGTSTITAPSGGSLIGPYQNKATANTPNATISTSGAITGTSLSVGTGSIACGAITTSGVGLITANSGVKSSSYDASDTLAGQPALTIGSSVVHGNIIIGNAQTDGDIIIGASDVSGATITVGTASTATTINGTLTANNGLTLASGQYITTSHSGTVTAPTSTQVGGIINGSSISTTPPTTVTVSSIASIALTAGTWVLSATRQYNNSQNSSRINFSYGDTLRTSVAQTSNDNKYGMVSALLNNQINYANISAIVSLTASATIYLNVYMEYTVAPSIGTGNFLFNAVRIA